MFFKFLKINMLIEVSVTLASFSIILVLVVCTMLPILPIMIGDPTLDLSFDYSAIHVPMIQGDITAEHQALVGAVKKL